MIPPFSLFNMKITLSVRKSSHQNRGVTLFFVHLTISVFIHTLCTCPGKFRVILVVMLSKLDNRPQFNDIYHNLDLI